MLRIVPRGPDTFLLLAEDHSIIGWIRGRVVRFTGYRSRAGAVAAALAGGRALAAYGGGAALAAGPSVARPPNGGGGSAPRVVPPRPSDAAPVVDEVLACGDGRPPSPGTPTYSIEFVLAEGMGPAACGTIAQVLHAAMRHDRRDLGPLAPRATA